MERLGVTNIRAYLNITNHIKRDENYFTLKLENLDIKQDEYSRYIYIHKISFKQWRMLNLKETHDLICKQSNQVTHCHVPIKEVILTKCIFGYIVTNFKSAQLYAICGYSKF